MSEYLSQYTDEELLRLVNEDIEAELKKRGYERQWAKAETPESLDLTAVCEALPKKKRAPAQPRLTFDMLGINNGEYIRFVEDNTIVCKVSSKNTVLFEGKTYTLSALTRLLKERNGTSTKSNTYQGGNYFTYNGVILTKMRI